MVNFKSEIANFNSWNRLFKNTSNISLKKLLSPGNCFKTANSVGRRASLLNFYIEPSIFQFVRWTDKLGFSFTVNFNIIHSFNLSVRKINYGSSLLHSLCNIDHVSLCKPTIYILMFRKCTICSKYAQGGCLQLKLSKNENSSSSSIETFQLQLLKGREPWAWNSRTARTSTSWLRTPEEPSPWPFYIKYTSLESQLIQ